MTQPATIKVQLSKPIKVNNEDTGELTLRTDACVEDLEVMDDHAGSVRKAKALIAQLAGIPPSSLSKMPAADFNKLGKIVAPFIE